jgi:hypothetical protein
MASLNDSVHENRRKKIIKGAKCHPNKTVALCAFIQMCWGWRICITGYGKPVKKLHWPI